jgi:hypothetical protein
MNMIRGIPRLSRTGSLQPGLLLILLILSNARVSTATLDFENLNASDLVATQYPGLMFPNAVIFTAGISLNEFGFPPHSGSEVASDTDDPISIKFSVPVLNFNGYFAYTIPLVLQTLNFSDCHVVSGTTLFLK